MAAEPPAEVPRSALLADIGGTNARFALARDGRLGAVASYRVDDFPGPVEAIRAFLTEHAGGPAPEVAALAAAGPRQGDEVRLTNAPWILRGAELEVALGLRRVLLLHDFAATALAVGRLGPTETRQIGGGQAESGRPVAVIGPGTGLGMACLLSGQGGRVVLASEGGHVTMAPANDRESAILAELRRRFGHVSAERLVSGEGLVNLHRAIAALEGVAARESDAAAITTVALAGDSPLCRETLDCFFAMLGTVAADLALTLNARGGVYLAGGILPRFAEAFAASGFRARFEDKGRFRDYLASIPTFLITHPEPAFLGLLAAIDDEDEILF